MDDIYVSKKPKKNNNNYDIPAINIPDINSNKYNSSDRDNYAPYRGKEKKQKQKKQSNQSPSPAPKKSKKKSGCFAPVRKIALILVIIFAVSYLLTVCAAMFSGYGKIPLKRNSYITFSQLHYNPLVKNILLIGVDGDDSSDSLRSDSMILVSLDTVHGKIKLSSFLRDSWVQIPGHKFAKLNAAYAMGGAQLLVDTLEYNFKVNINDCILVDFTMFTDIIDAVGGIDVEVTPAEAQFINRTTRHTVNSGESVHLDGAQALVYCRIRKLDSDYMRTYRQRKVINALLDKVKDGDLLKTVMAFFKVIPKIQTNMNPFEIACLAYRSGFSALFFDTVSTRIPTDSTSWNGTENSQSVVELDVPANAEYLYEFIYSGSGENTDSQD